MARYRKSARRSRRSRRNPSDLINSLLKDWDRALDRYDDMKISKRKVTALARRLIAAGVPTDRMSDLPEFIKGAWGDRY